MKEFLLKKIQKTPFIVIFILIINILSQSCTEEFEFDNDELKDYYVISAFISNDDTIQYIFIDKGYYRDSIESSGYPYNWHLDPIHDVSIKLTDDRGQEFKFTDCTEIGYDSIVCVVNEGERSEYYSVRYVSKINDRVCSKNYAPGRAFISTDCNIEVGRTYTLNVKIGDREFSASQTTTPPPTITDVKIYFHGEDKDGYPTYRPDIYMKDARPSEEDFIILSSGFISSPVSGYNSIICALSDKNLTTDINGLALLGQIIDTGNTSKYWAINDDYYCYVYSISKENYEYLEEIKKQLTTNGGLYSPTPSTPITNFSGDNIQGQFIVAPCSVWEGNINNTEILRE